MKSNTIQTQSWGICGSRDRNTWRPDWRQRTNSSRLNLWLKCAWQGAWQWPKRCTRVSWRSALAGSACWSLSSWSTFSRGLENISTRFFNKRFPYPYLNRVPARVPHIRIRNVPRLASVYPIPRTWNWRVLSCYNDFTRRYWSSCFFGLPMGNVFYCRMPSVANPLWTVETGRCISMPPNDTRVSEKYCIFYRKS